jgi:hypothetical protein
MCLRRRRPALGLPADPAATEHGRQAARSVVVGVGNSVTLLLPGCTPPQVALLNLFRGMFGNGHGLESI